MLLLILPAWAGETRAASWFEAYERAQRHLVKGRHEKAEAALHEALDLRARPGCRLRTYGIKYRDYLPHYYLGTCQQAQGRFEEARASFERSLAEGVIESCTATQLQLLDLNQRLEDLDLLARLAGAEAPAVPSDEDLSTLRRLAVEAGAENTDELGRADAARERHAGGDADAAAEARRLYLLALSRARVEGPLLALLRSDAEAALAQVELAARGLSELPARFRTRLVTLRDASTTMSSAEAYLQVEREATDLRSMLDDHGRSRRVAQARLRRAAAESEVMVSLVEQLLESASERPKVTALRSEVQALRRLKQAASSERDQAEVVTRAERLRARLLRLSDAPVQAAAASRPSSDLPPGVLVLQWSQGLAAVPGPVLELSEDGP
ncbi:MAG: hypothetical protein AAF533_21250 [Acidobacteriota bacterium]